ncbi:MAG: protein meaA [Thermoleophilaceae bacterium]|nr:protein meaA [Thermoleophilaceae bacterium]
MARVTGARPYNSLVSEHRLPQPDRPWVMRTYAGHSTARESNALYRGNLGKGQTGLSIAFDLPTQTGYDPDHELSRGEVGKVGVSIAHKGDMHALLDGIPLNEMNTSMTINATAAWLLALYMTVAEENGVPRGALQGTTQNDIIKEFLSRGTYAFPPEPSMRLAADMIAFTVDEVPRWNPINVCSYHLQEAGATPVQEIAYALSTAVAVLDRVRRRVPDETFPRVFGRISFFVNAGIRFIEEHAKLRAMAHLWEEIGRSRYGVDDDRMLRFRYGVQVNSLGLTESQPENNIIRIVLEALAVTLGRDARARAIQLPAWNEALGLPRPWDQQWSLRAQQILAYETDVLEYPDIFRGSRVMDGLVEELVAGAREEMAVVAERGGAVEAVPYMKTQLVESHRERVRRIESGELRVVGQNCYVEAEPSPLAAAEDGGILRVDPSVEAGAVRSLAEWRSARDDAAVSAAVEELGRAAADPSVNLMPYTLACARAGATTGEWAGALRAVFGEYRAPTGVADAAAARVDSSLAELHDRVDRVSEALGRRVKILVGKPGLDGHSNGAEQIAVRARDAGMDVVYEGIRLTPARIARTAVDEGVHVVGLSILSGSHAELIPEVLRELSEAGADVPVVVGGIIPPGDEAALREAGVARVYTPKDFEVSRIMGDIVDLVAEHHGVAAVS